ncbi:hypothetical protein [Legionella tunisiensis]|uniref:hypothetical protein n=1 Tax=Legionella tunisiensis TaxID=1034944 RepID=UPI00031A8857|nr:hypothetical protein [Legionella tunisiensis]
MEQSDFTCLLKYAVNRSKIYSGPQRLSEIENGIQDGKQVTIYTSLNADYTPEDWQILLQEVNELLVKNNIQPGLALKVKQRIVVF